MTMVCQSEASYHRSLWKALVIILVSVPITSAQDTIFSTNPTSRPNIVFIMADDLGWNDVQYHNLRWDIYTPNINQLSREGVRLENYYVLPVCTPTRSQFLSGRSQIHTGLQHKIIYRNQPNALPLDSPTLPDKLKEAGYSTHMVGKWHLGFFNEAYVPTNRGFDTFYGMYLGSGHHFKHTACLSKKRCPVDLHNDTSAYMSPDLSKRGVYSTRLYTDEATRIIRSKDKADNPFFMFLSYQATHGPMQVPQRYRREIETKVRNKRMGKSRKTFSAMALAMDYGIGEVVSELKRKGLWDNTVLVFSTDNGASGKTRLGGSNLPLRGSKGSYHEGGIRGVGFVSSPLLRSKGYSSNELIHVTDWFPTFVALANGNLDRTRQVTGFNQWETLSLGAKSPREEILYNIDPMSRSFANNDRYNHPFDVRVKAALRRNDYKIITGKDEKPGLMLFNVKADPLERFDLSGIQAYQPKVKELLDALAAHNETAVPVRYPRGVRLRFVDYWQPYVA